jgi:hypothetical protein
MRKRGFIVLLATIPTWATAIVLSNAFHKQTLEWCCIDTPPPDYLLGVGYAAVIGTVAGVFVVLIDLNSWLKKRKMNERVG